MAYEKRLCVLKQVKKGFTADGAPLSGAVYAERLGEELTISPRLTGIAPVKEGRYALSFWVDGQNFCLEVKGNNSIKVPKAPSLKDGFAVLLCFVRSAGAPEPVAFGSCGRAPKSHEALLNVFLFGKDKKKGAIPTAPAVPPVPTQPQIPRTPPIIPDGEDDAPFRDSLAAQYDDEAISATNYYDRVSTGDAYEDASVYGEEQAQADGQKACGHGSDDFISPILIAGGGLTYYYEIKEKLQKAFEKYPKDSTLLKTFPHSEWVNAEGSLLGVIYQEGRPCYVCLATAKTPPSEWEENAVFVPVSDFSDTEGYYILFQDADTGEYVKVAKS